MTSFRKIVEREEGGPERKDCSRIPIWNSVYASWIFTLFLQFLNLQESPCLGSQLWQVVQGDTLQQREGRETVSSFPDGSHVPLVTLLQTAGSFTFPNSSLSLFARTPGKKRNCLWQRQHPWCKLGSLHTRHKADLDPSQPDTRMLPASTWGPPMCEPALTGAKPFLPLPGAFRSSRLHLTKEKELGFLLCRGRSEWLGFSAVGKEALTLVYHLLPFP